MANRPFLGDTTASQENCQLVKSNAKTGCSFVIIRIMSGHSKWSNIKNKKNGQDEIKGKIFSQFSRQIRAVVKAGKSGDPNLNAGLRMVLDKARAANMPKDKIQRAIDVALGKTGENQVREIVYEAFAPGGVALMIVALTDNNNRTAGELRTLLNKHNGSLAGPGSAAYMFERDQEGGFLAKIKIKLDDSQTTKVLELVNLLRDNEDVEDIFVAADLPEEE
jgi:transcriptional/translational regulatory protein YebC/TACO1